MIKIRCLFLTLTYQKFLQIFMYISYFHILAVSSLSHKIKKWAIFAKLSFRANPYRRDRLVAKICLNLNQNYKINSFLTLDKENK